MTRRTFLQSVIAVPLVAVGMPLARRLTIVSNADGGSKLLITSGGDAYVWPMSEAWREAISASAADLARRVDEEALARAYSRFLPNG